MVIDQFVIVVVIVFVIAIVAIGTDGRKIVICGWCYRALIAMIICHVRELKINVVQGVMSWGRRTPVRITFVGVEVLVLTSDEVEVIVTTSRGFVLNTVDLLTAEDLRLRHVSSTLQQRARRTIERMLAGLHL